MNVFSVGHGAREAGELIEVLRSAGVQTLVDVRRFPGSRRHPQFNRNELASTLSDAGISYRHDVELGGRRVDEPGEERFACIEEPAFRSYAARIGTDAWQEALARALSEPAPCFMCAESSWRNCHRRLIADLLVARGFGVVHLLRPGEEEHHQLGVEREIRSGRLYLCGALVA